MRKIKVKLFILFIFQINSKIKTYTTHRDTIIIKK